MDSLDVDRAAIDGLAGALIDAYDHAQTLPPITATHADFDVAAAYDVLHAIEARRRAQGWVSCGRKIGFTNRTIWPRYRVYRPMWAHVWTRTVHQAPSGRATLSLTSFVQPRIEPEVVFGGSLRASRSCKATSQTGSSRRRIAPRRSGCTVR